MSLAAESVDTLNRRRDRAVQQFIDRRVPKSAPPTYDSAVIAGNGIGAQAFAAQLVKHPSFEGRVTLVGPPVAESRRLVNGVSLRGLAADFLCSAIGIDHSELLRVTAGIGGAEPVAHRQTAAMATSRGDTWTFRTRGPWQGGSRGISEPLVYGIRNTRLVAGLRELLADHPITYVEEMAESAEHLRSHATGSRPLLVNATTKPGLLSGESTKPRQLVLAVQAPMITTASASAGPLQPRTTFAPVVRREGILDVGYFTPFSDPLSPRSTWYGIFARVVDADSGFEKDRELDVMTAQLRGVAEAIGLAIDDESDTLARALVPASPWGQVPRSTPGTLDLKRMYSGGAPCYYADGMVSSAIGGVIGAEAVLRGHDPDVAIRHALRPWRRHNFMWWLETNKIARLADLLLSTNVRAAMAYPHTAGLHLWKSAA